MAAWIAAPRDFRRTCQPAGTDEEKKPIVAGSAKRSFPRREDFRYYRHQESEAGGRGANLPRLTHAYAGRRSER